MWKQEDNIDQRDQSDKKKSCKELGKTGNRGFKNQYQHKV